MQQIDIYNIINNTVVNFQPHFSLGLIETLECFDADNTQYYPMLYLELPISTTLNESTITYNGYLWVLDRVDIVDYNVDRHKILNKTEYLSLLIREYWLKELPKFGIEFNMNNGNQVIKYFKDDVIGHRQSITFTGANPVYRCDLPTNTNQLIDKNNCY